MLNLKVLNQLQTLLRQLPPRMTSQTNLNTYKLLISHVLFYASEPWRPQKTELTKMQCFQNEESKCVTQGSDNRGRLVKINLLPLQIFLKFKDLLFLNKFVSGCFSFNFDNFISRCQANGHNRQHDVVYCYRANLIFRSELFPQDVQI